MSGVELHDEVVDWMTGLDDNDWNPNRGGDRPARRPRLDGTNVPFSKALGDGLFEVRFALGTTARRITYRFTTARLNP